MGDNTKIEWADKTFNPWTGCAPVSPACDHCYAEGWSKRSGHVKWRPKEQRRRTSAGYWHQPLKWNRAAEVAGERHRVFCASLADVFDNNKSILPTWRADLWNLIRLTPNLDWLLLTKRPQNIARYLPDDWGNGWPNVWLGTTVENQEEADRRIPHLLATPAAVRFLSCEPLLGPVDLTRVMLSDARQRDALAGTIWTPGAGSISSETSHDQTRLDWVIVGGESGPGARPMNPDWARGLRDQCQASGVPYFFKQWGEYAVSEISPGGRMNLPLPVDGGTSWLRWDCGMWRLARQGEPAKDFLAPGLIASRIGKKRAGRLLDGREWNEMPEVVR